MRILITNDDGMAASQLVPLIRWCKKLGQITVVVPKVEQSGKSHGIELHRAFEAKQVALAPDISAWAVDSTPADCVRFAILGLKQTFDLVITGVNRGYNIGTDIVYSGTVSSACEAAVLGVKAVALSTCPENYENACTELDQVLEIFRQHRLLERHGLYNVNIPPQPRGYRFTRQGGPYYSDDFPAIGDDLYRPTGKCVYVNQKDMTLDTDAVMAGYISIMPLTYDRTDKEICRALIQNDSHTAMTGVFSAR